MKALASAPATVRNSGPILGVLKKECRQAASVLEIGSGTGEHAEYMAAALPHLQWQPSDRAVNLAEIAARVKLCKLPNLRSPFELDVAAAVPMLQEYDVVYSSNTAHIMSAAEVERMVAIVGQVLTIDGRFLLYGPFRTDGRFSTSSNEQFDASLKARKPTMGIRDLEWMDRLLEQVGMRRQRRYAMPSNNLLVVWQRQPRVVDRRQ